MVVYPLPYGRLDISLMPFGLLGFDVYFWLFGMFVVLLINCLIWYVVVLIVLDVDKLSEW